MSQKFVSTFIRTKIAKIEKQPKLKRKNNVRALADKMKGSVVTPEDDKILRNSDPNVKGEVNWS